MAQFAALVRSAVGFDEERGDTLEVANLRFAELEAGDPAAHDASILGFTYAELMRIAEILVLGIVGILVLLLVVRPLVKQLTESQAAAAAEGGNGGGLLPGPNTAHPALAAPPGSTLPAIPGAQAAAAGPSAIEESMESEMDKMIDLNKVEGRVRASSMKKIGEIVEKHPDEAVAIVRHWLYQQE